MSTGVKPSFTMSGQPICCRNSARRSRPKWMAFNLVIYYRLVDGRLLPIFLRPGKNACYVLLR